jgi:purine-nucleoside phosphorylase
MNSYGLGAETLSRKLKSLDAGLPAFHVVLGSGFKDSLIGGIPPSFQIKGEIAFHEIEGLHASTAPGHAGKYVIVEHTKTRGTGLLQVGRLHGYEGLDPREVVQTVMISRELGAKDYFITNAAGGIDPAHRTGDVMIITDQINLSGKSPLTGLNPRKADGTEWGPRFQDLTRLFDREWNSLLKPAMTKEGLKVHEGVYMGVPGPAFETPAEIRFFATAGAQAVGMSTVWETIALKHSGARVCGISLISNLAAGLQGGADGQPEELDHFAILDACKSSSIGILRGILLSVERVKTGS